MPTAMPGSRICIEPGRSADDAGDIDRDLDLANLREGVVGTGMIIQRHRTAIGGELIGAQPVLAHDDGVSRDGADRFDELREVIGDLRVGYFKIVTGRRDAAGFAQLVDLDDPWDNGALRGLPDETEGQSGRQKQRPESHEPPVLGLHTGRSDAVVPDLRCLLIGRLGFWGLAVGERGAFEHQGSLSERLTEVPPPGLSLERRAWVAAVAPWWSDCRVPSGWPKRAGWTIAMGYQDYCHR